MKPSFNLRNLAIVALLMITGCSVNAIRPFPDTAESKVVQSDILVNVSQQEIYAEIDRSNTTAAMGGGLLFALIDSAIDASRADDAEEYIQPVKESLFNYSFDKKIKDVLDENLANILWLHSQPAVILNDASSKTTNEKYSQSKSDIVMVTNLDYHLSPNLSQLIVSGSVSAYPKTSELIELRNNYFKKVPKIKKDRLAVDNFDTTLYYNKFYITYRIKSDGAEEAIGFAYKWSKNEGQVIKQALDQSIECMAKMIAYDINSKEVDKNNSKKKKSLRINIDLIPGVTITKSTRTGVYQATINHHDRNESASN
ncbi:MAG: hypothetical protein Q9M92_02480 [Enterobacterales bacterium]|nr:hypothetical protein [Enterobacterales bacterium]